MKKPKRIEIQILVILWTMSLSTYSIALLKNYNLFASDYFGLSGLTIVTFIAYIRPEKLSRSILVLLLLGLFNLLSFAYFFNMIMAFGVFGIVTPGIQTISLVMLVAFVINKRRKLSALYKDYFGQKEADKVKSALNAHNRFKIRFKDLTDAEIEVKLQQGLVPEAVSALEEIKEERKNALDSRTLIGMRLDDQ